MKIYAYGRGYQQRPREDVSQGLEEGVKGGVSLGVRRAGPSEGCAGASVPGLSLWLVDGHRLPVCLCPHSPYL